MIKLGRETGMVKFLADEHDFLPPVAPRLFEVGLDAGACVGVGRPFGYAGNLVQTK